MNTKYKIRLYQQGDETEIVSLLELVFNGWPQFDINCTPLEHWNWKFLENPFSSQILMVAVDSEDNRIIGCHMSNDLRVKLLGAIYHFNQGVDLAVHPDFRRMGLWTNMKNTRLQILKEADIKFGFSSSANPIIIGSSSPHRLLFPRTVSRFYRVRDLNLHFNMDPTKNVWMKKLAYQMLKIINNILHRKLISAEENFIIKEISKFDSRVDVFWQRVSDDYGFIVERTQAYLNWRYCDPRSGGYQVLIAEDDGSLLGYCVFRINKFVEAYPRGYIVDLLTLPDRSDVSSALLNWAVEFFHERNVNVIQCAVIDGSEMEVNVRKCGFLDSRSKLWVSLSLRDKTSDEIDNIGRKLLVNKMHLVYGDFDTI